MPEQWKSISIKADLITLFELIREPISKEISINGKDLNQMASTLSTRNKQGYLNILVLQKDGLIKLTSSPISKIYLPARLFD